MFFAKRRNLTALLLLRPLALYYVTCLDSDGASCWVSTCKALAEETGTVEVRTPVGSETEVAVVPSVLLGLVIESAVEAACTGC